MQHSLSSLGKRTPEEWGNKKLEEACTFLGTEQIFKEKKYYEVIMSFSPF